MPLALDQERQFNRYGRMARAEFEKNWTRWDAADVARWWDKWCVDGKTHHDRLGRILLHCTGVRRHRGKPNNEPYLYKELDNETR